VKTPQKIADAGGKLGILLVGMGAVSTTTIAGVIAIRKGLSKPSPQHAKDLYPEHDLFIQLMKLKNTLRFLRGEELITHLGVEYYD
jgi:hypothetical protein